MPKVQTGKSRYESNYSPSKFVTAAQYIIELICEKKATLDKLELPIRFWLLPEWETFYKRQLRIVHANLKKYDERAIIRALQSPEAGLRYSFHTDFMKEHIAKFQKEVEAEDAATKKMLETYEPPTRTNINTTLRTPQASKMLSRLQELENGEEEGS